jgi:hypothetical protein
MIKPTIGRVVWFWPSLGCELSGFVHQDKSQPCAALVVYVHSDIMVNLHAIDQVGVGHAMSSVRLIQEGEPRPAENFCEWMPYQIGQAKAVQTKAAGAVA